MRTRLIALLAGTLALAPAPLLAQSEWVDIKEAKELSALFSNKTHRSRAYVAHFRTDGQGILQMSGSDVRLPRTWQVTGDQVCVGPRGEEPTCFRYQRSAKNPAEILATGEQRGQRVMHWRDSEVLAARRFLNGARPRLSQIPAAIAAGSTISAR